MTASYKILQHYRHIELVKKGSVVTGIKPIDHSEEWEKFTNSVLEWGEQLPTANIDSTLATFLTAADNQEMAFKELITFCNHYNEKDNIHRKEFGREILRYIGTAYADATDLRIANYVQYQDLSVSEQFLRSFLSLMNRRLHFTHRAIEELRNLCPQPSTTPAPKPTKAGKPRKVSPTYRMIGLFCLLISDVEIMSIDDYEKTEYGQAVCEKYNQPYSDQVRQALSKPADQIRTIKNLEGVKKLILPTIGKEFQQLMLPRIENDIAKLKEDKSKRAKSIVKV